MNRNTLQNNQHPFGMLAFGTVMGGAGIKLYQKQILLLLKKLGELENAIQNQIKFL